MRFPASLNRTGSLNVVVLIGAMAIAGGSVALVTISSTSPTPRLNQPPAAEAYRTALHQLRLCGMAPEELAAAGITAQGLDAIANAGADSIRQHGELATTLSASQNAKGQYDVLRRQVESGTATQEQKAAFDASIAAKSSAGLALAEAKRLFLADALAGVPADARQRLDVLAANNERHVPPEFRLGSRDDAQWLALRDACAAERIALQKQKPVPPEAAVLLADARASLAAVSAKASLDANLAALKAIFDPVHANP